MTPSGNKNNSAIDVLSSLTQFACAPIVSLPGLAAIAALRAVRDSKKISVLGNRQKGGIDNGVGRVANSVIGASESIKSRDPINSAINPVVQQLFKEILQSVVVSLVSRQVLSSASCSGLFGSKRKTKKCKSEDNFRLVCVTGTYQEGYANREMLNSGEEKAVFVGYALVRGCGLHFDVKANEDKDEEKKESQEEDLYDENDVAPVVVLTNDERDAVVYSVYAVPCDAIISNLFDSGLNARLMGVSSDTAAIDLAAAETSTSVRVAAQVNEGFGFALTMLSFGRPKKSSVCARPLYEKRDGTRVYSFNDEQLENCGITSGSSLAKIRALCVSSEKKESYAAEDVDEDTCEEKKKTNENNESFWPMDLLRLNKGIFETEGNSAEKMNEEEQAKAKKKTSKKPNAPPLGESSNQNNNDNVGFVTSFFPSLNVSAKKKSTEQQEENATSTLQQTPGALGDHVLYPATVASPWPDQSRDEDEDYIPDYEAEDFDYDDEPLSGGSSLMVTPTKEATGSNRCNGSFYESAATTPNAEKIRDEPRPFGSVNAIATSSVSSSYPTDDEEARSSEFIYSVDSESDPKSMDQNSILQAFKEHNSHWGTNNKIEKLFKEYKMPLGGAVDVVRLYTCTQKKDENDSACASTPRRKSSSIDKSTRLVDFASCERAMKYAETFHNDEKIDGGVLPKSRAVWLDGRRCRI